MFLFPFRRYILAVDKNRDEVQDLLSNITLLDRVSPEGIQGDKKLFFGRVTPEEFQLENLQASQSLVPFVSGEVRGIDRELYLFISFKAYRHMRSWILFLAFVLGTLGFLAMEIYTRGSRAWENWPFILLSVLIFACILYSFFRIQKFWELEKNSLNFFEKLLNARSITYNEVPGIFKI